MANKKISELTLAVDSYNADYIPLVQSGVTKKITKESFFNSFIHIGTNDAPDTSSWEDGEIYIQIEE